VVDEYQDISQAEYDFLQTLIEIAGEVRVIVVGDDDQNIYEFRGSSVEFMRSFVRDQQAKTYFLSKNYRAAANLVDFSNQFLKCFRSDRLKASQPLKAHKSNSGRIKSSLYPQGSDLILPLAEDLHRQNLEGSIAVLTRTNQEAMLLHHALLQKDILAQLIGQQEGFSLKQLLEVRSFTQLIRQHHQIGQGYIPGDTWQQCRDQVLHLYGRSANCQLALTIIDKFNREMGSRKFWSDWLAYLQEIRIEDFVSPEKERVLVSTMHKAKGKEFDHVYLLLDNYRLQDEASKRVIYVAITRARRSLNIHTNRDIFSGIKVEALNRQQVNEIYPHPTELQIETGMKDIWLNYFRNEYVSRRMKNLQAGDTLYFGNHLLSGLQDVDGKTVVKFSTSFKKRLSDLIKKGFKPEQADIAHVVVWFSDEDSRDYRVALPKLGLKRIDDEKRVAV
jgi:ATP-dependent DNA helicase RecQ